MYPEHHPTPTAIKEVISLRKIGGKTLIITKKKSHKCPFCHNYVEFFCVNLSSVIKNAPDLL